MNTRNLDACMDAALTMSELTRLVSLLHKSITILEDYFPAPTVQSQSNQIAKTHPLQFHPNFKLDDCITVDQIQTPEVAELFTKFAGKWPMFTKISKFWPD